MQKKLDQKIFSEHFGNPNLLKITPLVSGFQSQQTSEFSEFSEPVVSQSVSAIDTSIRKKETRVTTRGVFIFKPLEANIPIDYEVVSKMDPYCQFRIGWHSDWTLGSKTKGNHPTWAERVSLERKHNEEFAKFKLRNNNRTVITETLGKTKIPLDEIINKGMVTQWYNIYRKKQVSGQIRINIEFVPQAI